MKTSMKLYLGACLEMMGALFSSKAAWRSWGREPMDQQSWHLLCPERAHLLHSCR